MHSPLRSSLRFCLAPFALLLFAVASPAVAQWDSWPQQWPYLEVLDPQQGPWSSQPGTIEEARVVVQPKGIYAEVDLYLTLSARDSYFGAGDTLETALYFELPEDAAFTDSWLWFNGEILRAQILDGWTARETYEGIVRRNRDPSILYKRGGGRYELRVFPMEATESRRLKLTYIVPVKWTADAVSIPLPTTLLAASASPVDLEVWAAALLDEPSPYFPSMPERPFGIELPITEESLASNTVPASEIDSAEPIYIAYDPPVSETGVFYSTIERDGETWYQAAVLPETVFGEALPRRVAAVVDYEALGGIQDIRADDVLTRLGAQLSAQLTPTDSFAVVIADARLAAPHPVRWHIAHPDTVAEVIEAARLNFPGATSDMIGALAQGLGALGRRSGSVLLVSTDRPASVESPSVLIERLRDAFGSLPPVFTVNLDAAQTPQPNGPRWTAFYDALAEATGGMAQSAARPSSLDNALAEALSIVPIASGRFDLYTTREGGVCYDRQTLGLTGSAQPMDRAILQVGQCFGTGAFVVELGGVTDGVPLGSRVRPDAPTLPDDTSLIALWTATQIAELEAGGERPSLVDAALDLSLRERVLSKYTAFLALEPSQGGEVCSVCATRFGGPITLASEDADDVPQTPALEAYPNPFSDRLTITVTLAESTESVTAAVYNLLGQRVRVLDVPAGALSGTVTLAWDGADAGGRTVASGTYLIVLTTPEGRFTETVTLVR